jgi:hypothetical protein
LFSEEGISDEIRGSIWVKLLKADELMNQTGNNMYFKLVCMENRKLDRLIDDDKISERSNIQRTISGKEYAADPHKLKNIIKAYGNIDIELGYC